MKKRTFFIGICWIGVYLGACGKQTAEAGNGSVRQAAVESGSTLADQDKDGQEYERSGTINEAEAAGAQEHISAQVNEESGKTVKRNDPELEEWKQAYLRYLDTLEGAGQCAYSLIYVDDDEIPELAVDYGFDDMGVRVDGGCRAVLTFHDHAVDVWEPLRSRFTYIERGNRICMVYDGCDVNEVFHLEDVYMIQDGKWVYVGGGRYSERADTSPLSAKLAMWFHDDDYDWKLVREYSWNEPDEAVSGTEYIARLEAVCPEAQRTEPQNYYSLDDICSILGE